MDDWELAFRAKSIRRAHQRDYRMIAAYAFMGAVLVAIVYAIILATASFASSQ